MGLVMVADIASGAGLCSGAVVSVNVLPFPARPVPNWVPEPIQRELDAVEAWCADTQRRLARLAYADRDHHLAVRRIADALRSDIFVEWDKAQPRK